MLKTNRGKFLLAAGVGVAICIGLFAFGQWSAALVLLLVCGYMGYIGFNSET